jgi:hypothetical protein
VSDVRFGNLKALTKLETLQLDQSPITDAGLAQLGGMIIFARSE